jgi:uncharacterized protein YneF (UPF0154 family)
MGYVLVGGVCLFIGVVIGVFIVALCTASKYGDSQLENMYKDDEEDKK